MIDPEALAQFGEIIRAGGAIVCAPDVARRLLAEMPDDLRAEFAHRIFAHPWLLAGELWGCYPGVRIMLPTGSVAV